jgi:hypothetical protein
MFRFGIEQNKIKCQKNCIFFYKSFGCQYYGDYYKSENTGVIHRKISK